MNDNPLEETPLTAEYICNGLTSEVDGLRKHIEGMIWTAVTFGQQKHLRTLLPQIEDAFNVINENWQAVAARREEYIDGKK